MLVNLKLSGDRDDAAIVMLVASSRKNAIMWWTLR